MINLLPPEVKQGYRYARRNVVLRKWVAVFAVALIGLGAIATYGLLSLHQSKVDHIHQADSLQTQLNKEHVNQTNRQVADMSDSLKLTVKVLSNEVLFSKLIKQIGAAMPDGAALTGLTINTGNTAIDLKAGATNYTTATQVQVNLSDPANKIFSKADLVSVDCNAKVGTYPCTVSIRALFGDNSPYLFINQGKRT
jgi:hypothetical protein